MHCSEKESEIESRFTTKVMQLIINVCHTIGKGKWKDVCYICSILTNTQLRCGWLLMTDRVSGSPGASWSKLWFVIESHLTLSILCFIFFQKYLLSLSIIIFIYHVAHTVVCLAFSLSIVMFFLACLPVHQRLHAKNHIFKAPLRFWLWFRFCQSDALVT